ncbi:MAG TPA: hypothetical protein VNW92_26915 [Polyangiaceae bacterium]|nr:hypothetical protein [Polyangiaceae bacterium]
MVTGCGGRTGAALSSTVPSCVPGEQLACACSNGATGAQICAETGTFAACSCTGALASSGTHTGTAGSSSSDSGSGSSTHGAAGTASSDNGAAGGGGGGNSGSGSGLMLASGGQSLVDLFVSDAGLLLIFSDEVRLVSRAGKTLQSVSAPREVTAAAFDGNLLVVADKAKFTTYDPNLKQLASANLAVTCSSGVLMDDQRFVCGQNVDWDRVYYTYDALKGTLVASSKTYTYDGIPMRRAPGTNQFVAVEVASEPANLFLFETEASGEVTFLGPGPFEISDSNAVYAFSGNPATQVIVDDGTILEIDPGKCTQSSITTGCFNQSGALGTLSGAQRFIGLDQDLNGKVYALVDTSPTYDQICGSGCLVEQIDVASRVVSSQALYSLQSATRIVNVRHDATANALVVGYSTGSTFPSSSTASGYGVLSLPY